MLHNVSWFLSCYFGLLCELDRSGEHLDTSPFGASINGRETSDQVSQPNQPKRLLKLMENFDVKIKYVAQSVETKV
jgi:hypothetical protein